MSPCGLACCLAALTSLEAVTIGCGPYSAITRTTLGALNCCSRLHEVELRNNNQHSVIPAAAVCGSVSCHRPVSLDRTGQTSQTRQTQTQTRHESYLVPE